MSQPVAYLKNMRATAQHSRETQSCRDSAIGDTSASQQLTQPVPSCEEQASEVLTSEGTCKIAKSTASEWLF